MRRRWKRWEKVREEDGGLLQKAWRKPDRPLRRDSQRRGTSMRRKWRRKDGGRQNRGKRKVRRFSETAALHPVVSPGGEKYTVSAPAYSFGHTACTLSLRAPQSMPSCISRIYLLKSFLKKLVLFSLLLSPQLVANARRRSFCFWFRRRGTSTFTVRYRFPRIRG